MPKLTPRAKFIRDAWTAQAAAKAWDAMELASTHDSEHHRWLTRITKVLNRDLNAIETRLNVIERQFERIGAPQYRLASKGVLAEIVRGPRSAKNMKDYTL
jgi:hypothetical protein